MLSKIKIIGLLLFIVHCSLFTVAQADSTRLAAIAKWKTIPNLGPYKNGSKALTDDIKHLLKVNPTLVVKDEKGVTYQVVSFDFTWRQKSMSDDVISGKRKTTYNLVGENIKGNKLNQDWIDEINITLNKGDGLKFTTIIYYDPKKKRNMLAAPLTIQII